MVKYIRQLRKISRNGIKILLYEKNINIVRKSIVAKNNIKKGELFSVKNLSFKRLGMG